MTEPAITTLPDGAIRVCLGGRCATTSSQHLVPDKVTQLSSALVTGRQRSTEMLSRDEQSQ